MRQLSTEFRCVQYFMLLLLGSLGATIDAVADRTGNI